MTQHAMSRAELKQLAHLITKYTATRQREGDSFATIRSSTLGEVAADVGSRRRVLAGQEG